MEKAQKLVDFDGEVHYYEKFIAESRSEMLFNYLENNVLWTNEKVRMFGKLLELRRKTAWFSLNGDNYKYSGVEHIAQKLDYKLENLRSEVERVTASTFNSYLLNYYHDEKDYMGLHKDNETSMQKGSAIASVSLGAARTFIMVHQTSQIQLQQVLSPGSLLVMTGAFQRFWKHGILKELNPKGPRINITFRLRKE